MTWWTDQGGGPSRFTGTDVPVSVLEACRRKGAPLSEFRRDHPEVLPEHARAAWEVPFAVLYEILCGGPDARYGMAEHQFRAAAEAHQPAWVHRMGTFVPTRREVSTGATDDLEAILDIWFWESPTDLIPTDTQIAAARHDLKNRADAETEAVQALISLCNDLLAGSTDGPRRPG